MITKTLVGAGALIAAVGAILLPAKVSAQECDPPWKNATTWQEVVKACTDAGGTWKPAPGGDVAHGTCDISHDYCHKQGSSSSGTTDPVELIKQMPAPANMQQASQEMFLGASAIWLNQAIKSSKEAQARAAQEKAEREQRAAEQRAAEQRKRRAIADKLSTMLDGNGPKDDLRLVFDDSQLGVKHVDTPAAGYGIPGLPGVYTNGARDGSGVGASGSAGYGIAGLPGVYTAGPQTSAAQEANTQNSYGISGLPGVGLQPKQNSAPEAQSQPQASAYGIPGLPGVYTGGPREQAAEPDTQQAPSSSSGNIPEQPASQTAVNAGVANASSKPAKAVPQLQVSPSGQQLQNAAEQSQTAAQASTAERAAAAASRPFDNPSSVVDMRGTTKTYVDPNIVRGNPTSAAAAQAIESVPSPQEAASETAASIPPVQPRPASSAIPEGGVRPSRFADLTRAQTIAESGMLANDAEALCKYMQNSCRGTIIMQNVNAGATYWMQQGKVKPKPRTIKAKSSDRPEIAGLIPCNQKQDGKITDEKELNDAYSTLVTALASKEYQCVKAVPGQPSVLADSEGNLIVSDYDLYALSCAGDSGSAYDDKGKYGIASDAQRRRLHELNALLKEFPPQHGAELEHGGRVKLPATAFEYDPTSSSCKVTSLKDEGQVSNYLQQRGIKPLTTVASQ